MPTVKTKHFSLQREHSILFPSFPIFPPTLSLQKSLLSAHFCYIRGEWAAEEGEREFLPLSAACYLSHVQNPSLRPFSLHFFSFSGVLICMSLLSCGERGSEGNAKQNAGLRPSSTACWLSNPAYGRLLLARTTTLKMFEVWESIKYLWEVSVLPAVDHGQSALSLENQKQILTGDKLTPISKGP